MIFGRYDRASWPPIKMINTTCPTRRLEFVDARTLRKWGSDYMKETKYIIGVFLLKVLLNGILK